jgi:hypothetical protein
LEKGYRERKRWSQVEAFTFVIWLTIRYYPKNPVHLGSNLQRGRKILEPDAK